MYVRSRNYRGALAKFRSGTASIRIEPGSYEGLPVGERFCICCNNIVEDELHVLLHCPILCMQIYECYYSMKLHMCVLMYILLAMITSCVLFYSILILSSIVPKPVAPHISADCVRVGDTYTISRNVRGYKTCWSILECRRNYISCN
jgi:hypothetical protein